MGDAKKLPGPGFATADQIINGWDGVHRRILPGANQEVGSYKLFL
jgi:hypothetical protein